MTFPMIPIGMVFRVVNGATPKSDKEDLWDGDIPWITPADLGKIATSEVFLGARSITRQGLNSCGTQIVPAASVVLSIRAPVGHTAITAQPMCFNQGCRGLVPSHRVLPKFGYWAILSVKPKLQSEAQGTTFQELGRDKLKAIKIPVPDLATQRQIANFLDRETGRINALITNKKCMIALLQKKRSLVISEAVLGYPERSLRYLAANPIVNGVGEAAEFDDPSWPRYIRITDIADERALKAGIFKSLPPEIAAKAAVQKNDLLFAAVGATFGKVYLHATEGAYCYAGFMVKVTPNKNVLPDYLLFWAQSEHYWKQLRSGAVQATIQNFSAGKYRKLKVPVPDLATQSLIVASLMEKTANIDRVIALTRTSIERLKEYRSALITAAVTGQIDVTTHKAGQMTQDTGDADTTDQAATNTA